MKKFSISITLVAGILILLNLIAAQFSVRLDLTDDRRYTLSKATLEILSNLKEPVTVKGYFTEGLSPEFDKRRKEFREMLVEFNRRSGGKVEYEFINPNKEEKYEKEAVEGGVQPQIVGVREKDQVKQQKAYAGFIASQGSNKEVMPGIPLNPDAGFPLEYQLARAIRKVSLSDKPPVGYLQGHGEPPIEDLIQVGSELSVLYDFQPLILNDSAGIPAAMRTIVIVNAREPFPASQLEELDRFLARGGNILCALNRVTANLQTLTGNPVNSGLETWLEQKGIATDVNFVVDAKCGNIGVQQMVFGMPMQTQVPFPWLPILTNFADHPVTRGLEEVQTQFLSTVHMSGDGSKTFTPLAFTSEQSGIQNTPVTFDVNRQWQREDFPMEKLIVAGLLEGNFGGEKNAKIILIGDGDFAINGNGQNAVSLPPDNINFIVNGIDWMTDQSGLMDLRTRITQGRPIRLVEEKTKTILKYLNFLLPVIAALVYGLYRNRRNAALRQKRSEENYAA